MDIFTADATLSSNTPMSVDTRSSSADPKSSVNLLWAVSLFQISSNVSFGLILCPFNLLNMCLSSSLFLTWEGDVH